MNVENATSDDPVVVDDDLVAALGFEPANDILIIDESFSDGLSITTDDIQVSSGEAESVSARAKPEAKTKSTDKPSGAKVPKPQHKTGLAKTEKPEPVTTSVEAPAESPVSIPPPPKAEHAVLLAPAAVDTYGFGDVKLPDFKAALSRLRSNARESEVESSALVAETVTSPPVLEEVVARVPVHDGPPTIISDPQPQLQPSIVQPRVVEALEQPNVYLAPTRGGRTRIRSRKVRRQIRHIDPWSVLTFSFIFHLCFFGALLLASVLVWRFADGAGMIENVEKLWGDLADKEDFNIDEGALGRAAFMIAGLLTIASSVMLVLLTVFFNLISDLVGGVRVTVIEEEPVRAPK